MRVHPLRQILRPRIFLPHFRRFQHGGPHKEYFQNPGQFPAATVPQYAPPPQPTFPAQPSTLRRFGRSTFWAVSFGLLGIIAGTAALEGIKEIMSSHPLLDALGQDEDWKEQAMYMEDRDWDQEKDFHFLSRKTLKGANGISMVCLASRPNEILALTCSVTNRHSFQTYGKACLA
jgi:hypothetical protein